LSHLAKIGAPTAQPGVSVHCPGKGGGDIYQARLVRHLKSKPPQVFPERRATCRERDLGEQPKGVKESRVVRGALKACLGRIRGQACQIGNAGTTQLCRISYTLSGPFSPPVRFAIAEKTIANQRVAGALGFGRTILCSIAQWWFCPATDATTLSDPATLR
jgi:hypothetical protein